MKFPKLPKLPKIIGSVLNIRASTSVDVSSDLSQDSTNQKTIAQLLKDEEEKKKSK